MPMLADPSKKYISYKPLPPESFNRTWPTKISKAPPIWLSTDLRDGNQSLAVPMSIPQKMKFFKTIVAVGVKEIEIAYPAASDTDFGFVRNVVEQKGVEVPDDVWIQVLTPARADLIERTFQSVAGAKKVIIHMYNATCPLFRQVVFSHSQSETTSLAVEHTKLIKRLCEEYSQKYGTRFRYEYSPETFSQSEMEFVVDLCTQVQNAWWGSSSGPSSPSNEDTNIIFNLPSTVEISPPNHYADQVEYFDQHIPHRSHVIISLHNHNDRGTAVASSELGVLAGGQRIEGCFFGNGERTGNVDLVTLALNLYTQGIHPKLDLSNLQEIIDVVIECNNIGVHERHPYGGELVFTAFSGSHQDAIKKGFQAQKLRHKENEKNGEEKVWSIPYLPVDPADLGFTYDAVIRVNSQSGKGGIAYLIKEALHLDMPRKMQISFYRSVQEVADREGREITVEDVVRIFRETYWFGGRQWRGRLSLRNFKVTSTSNFSTTVEDEDSGDDEQDRKDGKQEQTKRFDGTLLVDGKSLRVIRGEGNGPLSSFLNALRTYLNLDYSIREYSEHIIGEGTEAKAASYIELIPTQASEGQSWWGVGVGSDITGSGLRAVLSAVNCAIKEQNTQLVIPEIRLNLGYSSKSTSQDDISQIIVNSLGLELPRRFMIEFFEVLQKVAMDNEFDVERVVDLFKETYSYPNGSQQFALDSFKLTNLDGNQRELVGEFSIFGEKKKVTGTGNGPLSSFLDALHKEINGKLSIREYSEHSIGEGSEVLAASYVELIYEEGEGKKKRTAWGVAADEDITGSGIKAALSAANRLDVVRK